MNPTIVGRDKYFRSTETLTGYHRETADAINSLALRVTHIERSVRMLCGQGYDADLTEKIDALVREHLSAPGAVATVAPPDRIFLPAPVVFDVEALVERAVVEVEGLDVPNHGAVSTLRRVLDILAPYLPDRDKIRDYASREALRLLKERL